LKNMAEDILEGVYKSVVKEEEEPTGHYIAGKLVENAASKKEGLYPAGLKMEDK
jgi:hypothetical protein